MLNWTPETAAPWLQGALPQPVQIERVHNGLVLIAGTPPQVVVRCNGAAMRLGVFGAQSWGDRAALADEPIASLTWNKLPTDPEQCAKVVSLLAQAAQALYVARYGPPVMVRP